MLARSELQIIFDDEGLTRRLEDPEARVLIEWLVDEADRLTERVTGEKISTEVRRLCRRARALARFVLLWSNQSNRAAATQLACSEQFDWPLPNGPVDPVILMQRILRWESRRLAK